MRTFTITTQHNERGWSASDDFYHLGADGGSSEDAAIDAIVGSIYAALAYINSPPRSVSFVIKRDVNENRI